jgi:hypothetical protein
MQFLDWLDRHLASNSHFYFYADELGWPLDYYPHGLIDEPDDTGVMQMQAADVQKPAETH